MAKKVKNATIESDTLLYRKNKLPATLALLGLVFNCLYFCLLYGIKDRTGETRWSQIDIGVSVILTLVLLLVTFLASEGIKGYNKKFCIPLLVIAVFQIARIFYFPLYGLQNNILTIPYFWIYPTTSTFEFIMMVIWLVASAACLAASAILGYVQIKRLENHLKAVESGEIDMNAVFAAEEAKEAEQAKQIEETSAAVEGNSEVE
ncbi:MAG: hypothetical protein ACI4MB_02400 [Candidatus Coproplasma sp.]